MRKMRLDQDEMKRWEQRNKIWDGMRKKMNQKIRDDEWD